MADKSEYKSIIDNIIDSFKAQYAEYNIYDYDEVDENDVELPAILIQLPNFENTNNPIREVFRVNATFRAYVCESYKKTNDGVAKHRVRDTALAVAKFVNNNDFGADNVFNKANFSYATEDDFNEKITSAEVWYVEWEQQIYSKVV
jgi:hypothetical protein